MREAGRPAPAIHHPGRHAVPPHSEFCRKGGARRLQAGLYRARKHQPRQSACRPRKSRTGCTNTARCSSPGGRGRSSPMPATSSAFRATRRSGSRATSTPYSSELPVDLLEFFILTPLPGSADHKALDADGVWMDPDMNKYDLEHVTTGHPDHDRGRLAKSLSRCLGPLLFGRAHRNHLSPRQGERHQAGAASEPHPAILLHFYSGKRASAAGRLFPPQSAKQPPLRPAARKPAGVLPAPAPRSSSQPTPSSPPSTSTCTRSAAASNATPTPTPTRR